ncbi:hypothetical protein VTN00DRAFT_7166 [Thermoascus crustaceus]|uniref:uncharacterized protein n=1 Tax=Thermoascus crustaceus TaxID=5088 RepID=UPI00374388AE
MAMLLKPATPLTILLFAAFVLLLLSVLSTPIIKSIPLGTFENVDLGVFGYCKGNECSRVRVGYSTDGLFGSSEGDGDFNLPSSARSSLSSILIVHPVAAFLTLICLCLAAAAHFHAPSHSPRYLLGLLILLLPTLLVSLLAFLVDILLFVPHMQWGGWIVLAATILLVTCGVVTCAMRRTLVSRKARKRRIAENAEMNGENFYNRQNAAAAAAFAKAESPPPLGSELKTPFVTRAPTSETTPAFATFETSNGSPDDDRVPLNSGTPNMLNGPRRPDDQDNRYGPPGRGDDQPYNVPRDDFGNPLPFGSYGPGQGMRPEPSDPRLRNQYSDGSMGPRRGGPQGFGPRGRGGYPMRGGYGRGGPYGPGPYGPPRGPPNARGGPMGPMRGGPPGPGMMMGRGQRGPPPGYPRGRGGAPRAYDPYGPGPRPQLPPNAPRYELDDLAGGDYGYQSRGPPGDGPPRRPSPGAIGMDMPPNSGAPVGQAIEMTPQASSPSPDQMDNRARGDSNAQGTTSSQQQTLLAPPTQDEVQSPTSVYSDQLSYVPPRAGWTGARDQTSPAPLNEQSPVSPVSPIAEERNLTHLPPPTRPASDYYEDIDPRFLESPPPAPSDISVPAALIPGPPGEAKLSNPHDGQPGRPRSPSETSHFTSISERGINPMWRPPMPASRIIQQQRQDMLLGNNPDFDLQAGRGRGGAVERGGRMPTFRGDGRYPVP